VISNQAISSSQHRESSKLPTLVLLLYVSFSVMHQIFNSSHWIACACAHVHVCRNYRTTTLLRISIAMMLLVHVVILQAASMVAQVACRSLLNVLFATMLVLRTSVKVLLLSNHQRLLVVIVIYHTLHKSIFGLLELHCMSIVSVFTHACLLLY
jgi:hypothetical protein